MTDLIRVVQPFLPPLEKYTEKLESIWESGILTHNGPNVRDLESRLCDYLGVANGIACSNGTVAIELCLRSLALEGEVITTPFTWIATKNAIVNCNCKPVYCDIDVKTLNIDVDKIEACITDKTVAILPVHVFGNPCDVYKIEEIANKYNLKVIYDAAHAIGSSVDGKSLLSFGDASATSLHATKIINTAEGGMCFTNSSDTSDLIKSQRFFGFNNNKDIVLDGMNGKMSEINAALGVVCMDYLDDILNDRERLAKKYISKFELSSKVKLQEVKVGVSNYSYFPIILDSERTLLDVEVMLKRQGVESRRYFYPCLDYKEVGNKTSIAADISRRILCLPLYYGLADGEVERIGDLIIAYLNNRGS